jgi:hypothetical protein
MGARVLKLEDPTSNSGRGWVRLTAAQLIDLLYIGLKLAPRRHRAGLVQRDASKADAAAKAVATALAGRLEQYPIFGPARPADGPTCGQHGTGPETAKRDKTD